ncbi:MAG: four helix bundle protein [Patescibacteria group bacterium]
MTYIPLDKLKIYQLSVRYGQEAWIKYELLDWHFKKIIGDQFIRSVDSVGANIAEGYGRYHYLDKIKFYYNSRGSLFESKHWLDRLLERKMIARDNYLFMVDFYKNIQLGLNGLINSTYKNKN